MAAAELPKVDYLADVLVNELIALSAELVLVLDDYHLIRSSDVHYIMRHLLRYLPPSLHLVILTRFDPPLLLGRLHVKQQITEVRGSDLRFAPAETELFLQRRVGQPLDDAVLQSLQIRTEGWITGLQLASISLQTQDPRQFLARFRGSDRLLAGYLVEEVMAHLPDPMRKFLLHTAIVNRFCAPLADALLADSPTPASGRATITRLEEQNLFLIPLDHEGIWYRYHDLFRDFLLYRLKHEETPDCLARLHQRASEWFAQADLIEEALSHALAAGDEARAASLVETRFHVMLERQIPTPVLERWLDLFSEQAVNAHPGLLIAQATLFALRSDHPAMAPLLGRIETVLPGDLALSAGRRQLLQADFDLLRGIVLYWQGEARRAMVHLQNALDHLPVTHPFVRAQAIIHLGLAYANSGQREAGLALLQTALAEATTHHRPTMIVFLGTLAAIYYCAGELVEAARTAERLLSVVDSPRERAAWQGVGFVDVWRGWAHYFLGAVGYERNDFAAAAQHWRQVETLRYRTYPRVYHDSLVGLTLIARAKGEVTETLAYAQAAREFAEESHSLLSLAISDALEVRLALLGGKPAEGIRRSQDINATANQSSLFWLELLPLTRMRALLAEAAPTSLTAALQIAETCLQHTENAHHTRQVIQIAALQALALHALRRTSDAFNALEQALTLAAPGGFVRTFLDLGTPLAELLRQFGSERGQSKYVQSLLAAFAKEQDPAQRRELTGQYAKLYGITPLTPRELELLALISQRRTIQEIAEALVISSNTVKKHANNIYTKLGVRNRRQAQAKAQALGLLPPP